MTPCNLVCSYESFEVAEIEVENSAETSATTYQTLRYYESNNHNTNKSLSSP
jgi:hypothetical protein